MTYEPKPGTDWEEGASMFGNVRRWRTRLGAGLYLHVAVGEQGTFTISRIQNERVHDAPRFDDMGRIERDFGVRGWSVQGTFAPLNPEMVGAVLVARAVDDN